ncbi:MAG: hypothetical protein JWQ21_276 [Herminiimonas sp.]|nr:hypothetical protein [Herminiimonas sp.]
MEDFNYPLDITSVIDHMHEIWFAPATPSGTGSRSDAIVRYSKNHADGEGMKIPAVSATRVL